MVNEGRQVWTVRRCDVLAGAAWLGFLGLAVRFDVLHHPTPLMPWCFAVMSVAAVLTLVAYLSRHLARLESQAFERGLRAGLHRGTDGVTDMLPRPRDRHPV